VSISVGYATVGRDDDLPGSPIYVLESPEFTLDQASQMHFDYYVRSASALLEVRPGGPTLSHNECMQACLDNINNCSWKIPSLSANPQREWDSGSIAIPAGGRHKVLFVARDLSSWMSRIRTRVGP
jgi:hypothetical protein